MSAKARKKRRLKWLPILDEYTRECLALEVEYCITSRDVIDVLQRLVQESRCPGVYPLRQRPRVHCAGDQRLDRRERNEDPLHRAGVTLGEPLKRDLQQPFARRVP